MDDDLVTRLTGSAGIAALIGTNTEIGGPCVSWFARVRGDVLPGLVLNKISPGREYTHNGADGLDAPRVQFDCMATTAGEAYSLSRAVLACMEQPATVGETTFHIAFLEGENWTDQGEQDGGEPLFVLALDFIFYHEET